MKSIIKFLVLSLFLSATALAADNRQPLVSIDFTNFGVNYQQQLYYATTEALKAKKNVTFDVVGYGNYANYFGTQVANDMVNMGIKPKNITVTVGQPTPQNAVLIFVR